ncbi:5'-nucleotidase C-terminal domain-containing protein [Planococcus beigongshangi]|uniref:5'-nucleotidase C-terminal domain-containing protein n=1 Tax=Planococcus beigongshangi TaxID=2782536 RepID=UPI00193C7605|nr:5'-nucleotidase C-terminal domain-containing protein [Planococcus beigongshangi]
MKGKMFKSAVVATLAISAVGIQSPLAAKAAEGDFNLTIMHTNDTHANLDNVAKRVTLVNQIREENPNNLLLDAGDVFSGTLYFNTYEGQVDLEFMNLMKYDAMTFGNHEFDLGASDEGHKALGEFVGGADFPFVAANVDFSEDEYLGDYENNTYTAEFNNGEIYNGIIKEIDGEEIGIFGLTTEETANISSPEAISFSNYIEAAEEAVAAFEAAGVNKIIALTHIGYNDSAAYDNDLLLAEAVEGIDVIVGGHSHTELKEPFIYSVREEPTVIVQANEYNKFLGQLDITFDTDGVITSNEGQLHNVGEAVADEAATEKLAPFKEEIEIIKETSIGVEALVPLNGTRNAGGVRASETNLGNLITDGMLATAKKIDPDTVIAVQNGGGIRDSINAGDITMGEVLKVMPFGNALAIMDVTGAELLAALEHAVKDYPAEHGGFLHVSGMKFYFNPAADSGSRVTEAFVETENGLVELDLEANYKVATNTFIAQGRDGFASFGEAYKDGRVSEPGNIDFQMFVDYLQTFDAVNPQMENRINPVYSPFKDIYTHWSKEYVEDLYLRGVFKGTSPETFSPNLSLTRTQATSIIVRALDLDVENAPKSPFGDISSYASETQKEIDAAYDAELVKGIDNNFMPNKNVTRSQFALMLYRAMEYMGYEYEMGEIADFKDISGYDTEAQTAITMLYDLEIAEGIDRNFLPGYSASRAHAAKMLSNFIASFEEEDAAEEPAE